jgi:alpha-L-fucosidase
MMQNLRLVTFCFLILITIRDSQVAAQPREVKIREWRDLKYSMFIHFGIYSVLGGVWEGKEITKGLSEQIQAHAGIYSDTYEAVARQFNPVYWNADSIASLAERAGMRSVVITSKHHDGFCMFHSAFTDFNVVDATPFKRDIIEELAEACRRKGLKFGLYFSLIDWHYPQASPISSHNSDYITPEHHEYNKKQVRELLTNYGEISELWFDMGSQTDAQSRELSDLVHSLQPDCLVSSRIGNDSGDFIVMGDNQEPDYTIGVPWQSPASFFDETWGYRSWQVRGSERTKMAEKLKSLIGVVSRGGNYLLNIGPKGDGSVVDFERNVLLKMGKWLRENSDAIYGSSMDPFQVAFEWGNITVNGNKMYLHVLTNPIDRAILLPGLNAEVEKVYLLSDKTVLESSMSPEGMRIEMPKEFSVDDEYKVIVVEFKGSYMISPPGIIVESHKKMTLNSGNAYKFYSSSCIDYSSRFRSTVKESWNISSQGGATFVPVLYYSDGEKGMEIDLSLNNRLQMVQLDNGKAFSLKNDPSSLKWSSAYVAGPFWSGLEGAPADVRNIDVRKPWPEGSGESWKLLTDWQMDKPYDFPADMESSYFLLQEIVSGKDQHLLINVTAGDGVVVFLNGTEKLIMLNSDRENTKKYVLLLNLKKGTNQLIVKFFNRFRKNIICSIGLHPTQTLYRRELEPVELSPDKIYPVSWKLHNPDTPHQQLPMANLSLEMIRKGNTKSK